MSSNKPLRIENPHRNLKFWHKVQIHCHSSDSDARRGQTPKAAEEAYREAGYSCVFLTDHNRATPNPRVPGILHIDGAEYGLGRHHALALGIDRGASPHTSLDRPQCEGIESITGCACGNILERLTHISEIDRAIPVAAHPNARHFCSGPLHPRWCGGGWAPREIAIYAQYYSGLEIFNANNAARRMWSLNRWDEVLCSGHSKIWGFASDDCHDVRDERMFDRGWILVNSATDPDDWRNGKVHPDDLRRDILENIRHGNFWAVVRQGRRGPNGPFPADRTLWPEVFQSEGRITVAAALSCEMIEFYAWSSSQRETASASESDKFSYDVGGWEEYVRLRVVQKMTDGQYLMAFSQPLSIQRA